MIELSPWGWVLAVVAAVIVGLSKTGLPGLGVFAVAIFANILPAKSSTGALLPLLIVADVVGVATYRRHAVWRHLIRLFPWVGMGVLIGFWAMDRMDDHGMRRLIGVIVLLMVALHLWRDAMKQRTGADQPDHLPHSLWFAATMGLLAGFTTMVANAAGPVMIIFMLAIGLPKLEFLGTGAWFFMLVNWFKAPFSAWQGLINLESLAFNLSLAPVVILSAWMGRAIAHRLPQVWFARLTMLLTVVAGVRLLR